MTSVSSGNAALDGLPKPFVQAMRTLFDIMDDRRTGFVRFSEIERRWQDEGTQGMPKGVLGSLRKVTPPDGYLTFERFCAGLQICLLRNKMGDRSSSTIPTSILKPPSTSQTNSTSHTTVPPPPPHHHHHRPPSAPILDMDQPPKQPRTNANILPSVRPHSRAERTLSMPHLDDRPSVPPHSHQERQAPSYLHAEQMDPKTSSKVEAKNTAAVKPDIKMGVGGIIAHSKSLSCMQQHQQQQQGPPKPPRALERMAEPPPPPRSTQSLERNLERGYQERGHHIVERNTHSLDRDKTERKWEHERPHRERERDMGEVRRERGGSLERMLDDDGGYVGKAGIRTALRSWQMERTKAEVGDNNNNNNNFEKEYKEYGKEPRSLPGQMSSVVVKSRGVGDGGDGGKGNSSGNNNNNNNTNSNNNIIKNGAVGTLAPAEGGAHKKSGRRREPRRHTLQNGVDYSMLRRLKQLEAERDMLVQGLEVVDRARHWYKHQLQILSDRMHYLPNSPAHPETSLEAQQEKLHFQLARIHEVNAHLCALMEASEHGLPAHMNLAIRNTAGSSVGVDGTEGREDVEEQARLSGRLKKQNHLLTEEVSKKSDRITVLEREKAALLRELFQARSQQRQTSSGDSTFM
ncbi:suppressor APC domain-containing protein 2 [Oratosquilla oratoria]|uniref:suppressor APC domain-containing protein 2 n=1 Tax=Oratosquilla oratoria TaxID=337810 RepID=UPI003F76EBB8